MAAGNSKHRARRLQGLVRAFAVWLSALAAPCLAQDAPPAAGSAQQQPSLEEVAKQLENPASPIWSLTFQHNVGLQSGELVTGKPVANTFFFQPALPIPVRKSVLILRPVFPIISVPLLSPTSPSGVSGRQSGIGDMQLLAMLGKTTKSGWVYTGGGTFKFPTASSSSLGDEKYQAGPALALAKLGKTFVGGVSVQHWWSYAGNTLRADTNVTNIGYFYTRKLPQAWQVGMSPTVTVDWNAPADNHLTFPIGVGVSKMVRVGKVPTRFRFETQYSVVKPKAFGNQLTFRFQAVPVIKSPFGR